MLEDDLRIGDLVFTQIDFLPFRLVAEDTNTWTNHVGIVIDDKYDPLIAESTLPFSKITSLVGFVNRSKDRKVAVKRLLLDLTREQQDRIKAAATDRMRILYDTGFNLHSKRQFCSRFVHEILDEAIGIKVGEVETLRELFLNNPNAHLGFWRWWYFLSIPWDRQTITPASVFNDKALVTVFDGYA